VLLKRLLCIHQTIRSDKQKDHFIKCPFVLRFIFEVILELMQIYSDKGNVLDLLSEEPAKYMEESRNLMPCLHLTSTRPRQ